jgi:kanamycin kinase
VTGGLPQPDVPVPDSVLAVAAGRPVRPVWVNELGGMTYEVGAGEQRQFVKWAAAGSGIDLGAEASRMRWAAAFALVPRLLARGSDQAGSWLVSSALPGQMAVTDRWKAEPGTAVTAIGAGLRAMHDALPTGSCPFSWSAGQRLGRVRQLARAGLLNPAGAYGVKPDPDRTRYYRLLYDLSP